MTYTATDRPDTVSAAIAHASGILGPVIPGVIYLAKRRTDAFASGEAAKSAGFSLIMTLAFLVATAVRLFVPLVGFLGTLAQWVIPVVAAYFCLAGLRLALRGDPAHYPFQFKVVKTHD